MDLRCPTNPHHRHAVLDGAVIEIACRDCRRRFRLPGRVLHRWDAQTGRLLETVYVDEQGRRAVMPDRVVSGPEPE